MKTLNKLKIGLIIFAASLVLFLLAFFYYKSESGQIIKEKHEFLEAITNIKLEQIVNWRAERIGDAEFFTTIGKIIKSTAELKANKNNKDAKQYFSSTLKRFKDNGYFDNVFITDINGSILCKLDSSFSAIDQAQIDEIKSAVERDTTIIGNFYFFNTHKTIHFNVVSIIKDNYGIPIGVYVQIVDPYKSLYPIIQSWPVSSKSAETILFKKVDDHVVYLNDLRHKKNSALSLKIHTTESDIVSVKAVLGARGIIEGTDYRGKDVLAAVKTVPGTDWFMVSKVDKEEIYSELFYRAGVISLIALISILLISFSAFYIYKFQQSNTYKNLFLKEKELAETQEEYRTALYSIGDAVITTDLNGKIKQMNSVAEALTGWKEIEVRGKSLNVVFNVINEATNEPVENPVTRVLRAGVVVGLANHTMLISKKGNKIPIADSGSPIKNSDGKITGVVLVFRDQSEEREKEKTLLESEEKYRKMTLNSPMGMHFYELKANNDLIFIDSNPAADKILGIDHSLLFGKTIEQAFPSLVNTEVPQRYREAAFKGILWATEQIAYKDDKIEGAFEVKAYQTKPNNMVAVFANITERKIAEEIIKSSEANLNSLINNRNESIWSIDKDYKYVNFNNFFRDAYFEVYNQKLEKGLNALNLLTPELKAFWKPNYDIALSGERIDFEFSVELSNGMKYFQIFLNPILSDGAVKGVTALSVDITQRKKAEEALKESEQKYRLLFENNPHPMWVYDLETLAFLAVNDSAIAKYGYTKDEFMNMTIKQIRPEEDIVKLIENVENVTEGLDDAGVWRHKKKDGSIIQVEIVSHTLNFEGRKAEMILAHDVTEKILAERELKESQQRLSLALTSTKQGIYDLNVQTGVAIVTPEYATMLGYDPMLFNETNKNWIERLHPDDREITTKAYLDYIEGITLEYRVEFRQKTQDNKWKWILSLGKTVEYDSNGKPLRMLGTHTDITEQKSIEKNVKRLSRAVEQSPVIIMITDTDGEIDYVNPKFTEVTGYTFDEVINKNPRFLKSGHNTAEEYRNLWETITKHKEWRGEFLNKKKNGELYWESAFISPLINEQGKVTNYIAVKEDITERKKTISDLVEAKAKADEMNRVKAYFFANMSHELRTPFVGIMGFSEMLTESLNNPAEKEMAEQILKSSKRLKETLNKILNVTRLEFDKVDVKISDVDIVELIKRLTTLFSRSGTIKNTVIGSKFSPDVIRVRTDAKLVEEILTNLLNNAIKYTENGAIEIIVKNISTVKGDQLLIKVADTGIGIPKDKQEIIWQEFRQVSEGMNRSFEGTGLGLTIIKKYIDTLGGQISLESEPGRGSTFTIELPVKNLWDREINDPQLIEPNEPIVSDALKSRKPKILYIEDDVVALSYVDKVLRSQYEIDTAINATIALDLAKTNRYEVVLLDINLGRGIDGVELMQMMRRLDGYAKLPMVAVTAYAADSDRLDFLAKGFTHYLSKPFTSVDLKATLSRIFN